MEEIFKTQEDFEKIRGEFQYPKTGQKLSDVVQEATRKREIAAKQSRMINNYAQDIYDIKDELRKIKIILGVE